MNKKPGLIMRSIATHSRQLEGYTIYSYISHTLTGQVKNISRTSMFEMPRQEVEASLKWDHTPPTASILTSIGYALIGPSRFILHISLFQSAYIAHPDYLPFTKTKPSLWIKGALNKLVQINQSAFIPERLIQHNILLSQEIIRGYGIKNGAKRCAMKIDLQKAYDTVCWNFLEFILDKFGFHKKMEMKLVNLCFVDDLMIFCNKDTKSAGIIKEVLKEFSDASGLFPNLNKRILNTEAQYTLVDSSTAEISKSLFAYD
nr:RNA-directed DNA polymerase, eukaryota, reverse transcriptase zinc-binding domain protein [Tanacetum cinerariifolium]